MERKVQKVKGKLKSAVVDIPIVTEDIRLSALLKLCGIADTGGAANEMVRSGDVRVDGEVCTVRGKHLKPGALVSVSGSFFRVVRAQ